MTSATNQDELNLPILSESETEVKLTGEIKELWSAHQQNKSHMRLTKAELQGIRFVLGEKLYAVKTLLVQCGRGGRWASYLREHNIPRTSADRFVHDQEATLNPKSPNRSTGAFSEPTEAEVVKFVYRLIPRLCRMLTTQQALFDFVCKLLVELPGMDGDVTDRAVEIYRPAPEAALGEPSHTPISMSA